MALTPEQQKFKEEVDHFRREALEAVKEARQLAVKMEQQAKRFNKIEKTIRDMAREYGLIKV